MKTFDEVEHNHPDLILKLLEVLTALIELTVCELRRLTIVGLVAPLKSSAVLSAVDGVSTPCQYARSLRTAP
jgi:hypothetical protein